MSKAISVVFIVLMSLLAHSDCGVLRETRYKNQALVEVIQTLVQLTQGEVACGDTMVADIVFDGNAAFCKATKALQRVPPCNAIQKQLNNLIVNLQMAGQETSNCSFDENSQIQMNAFLINLSKFCKQLYRLQ